MDAFGAGEKMKVNDSGMPNVAYWESLFDIEKIVDWVNPELFKKPVVEIGCGYGTFTIPIAKRLKEAKVITFDIELEMIEFTQQRIQEHGLTNIILVHQDVVEHGINQDSETCDAVLLFNILHFKERKQLLEEASRILSKDGFIFVIHWRSDIQTPRGPALDIRPSPEDILGDGRKIGLSIYGNIDILHPYHWGIKLRKE